MAQEQGTMEFQVELNKLEAFKAMCDVAGLDPKLVLEGFINKVVEPPKWLH